MFNVCVECNVIRHIQVDGKLLYLIVSEHTLYQDGPKHVYIPGNRYIYI